MTDPELRDHLVALTRDLILMPSHAGNPTAIRQCYEFVHNHLDVLPGVTLHEYESAGIPSLVALPTGIDQPEALMIAHLDVVHHADAQVYRSTLEADRIVGPGAGDMKGALAILLCLFRRLHQAHPGCSLGLAVTTDEETGGHHGVRHLVDEVGLRCGCALIPDGGSLHEITVEEKGIIHLRLTATGTAAHAARPWLGDNPIPRLAAALERLAADFTQLAAGADGHWHPTCTVTGLDTDNDAFNRVPGIATAALDLRFPPPHTVASMLERVRSVVGEQIQAEAVIAAEPTHLSPDPHFVELTTRHSGATAHLVRESGGSDARFLTPHGIPVLMSRPTVGKLHAPDEWIEIDSMLTYYRICEDYLRHRLALGQPNTQA